MIRYFINFFKGLAGKVLIFFFLLQCLSCDNKKINTEFNTEDEFNILFTEYQKLHSFLPEKYSLNRLANYDSLFRITRQIKSSYTGLNIELREYLPDGVTPFCILYLTNGENFSRIIPFVDDYWYLGNNITKIRDTSFLFASSFTRFSMEYHNLEFEKLNISSRNDYTVVHDIMESLLKYSEVSVSDTTKLRELIKDPLYDSCAVSLTENMENLIGNIKKDYKNEQLGVNVFYFYRYPSQIVYRFDVPISSDSLRKDGITVKLFNTDCYYPLTW